MAIPPRISQEIDKSLYDGSETDVSSIPSDKGRVTFTSAGFEEHHRPIESYEGYHRYDPKFEWELEEERKVVRKVWTRLLKLC